MFQNNYWGWTINSNVIDIYPRTCDFYLIYNNNINNIDLAAVIASLIAKNTDTPNTSGGSPIPYEIKITKKLVILDVSWIYNQQTK